MAAAWIAAGSAIVGVISSLTGASKAEKAAKRQAREEARMERAVTTEKLRRLDKERRAEYGSRIAEYVGSGVLAASPDLYEQETLPYQGSVSQILSEQEEEYGFERQIIQEVGATKVQQSLARGQSTANYYRYSGLANAASGISNTITALIAAGKLG